MLQKPYALFRWLAVLGILVLQSSTLAALEWESQRISQTASVVDEKAEFEFNFTNTGTTSVTITSTRGSCGCTTARLDKKTFEPGESGKIKATFVFGDRAGKQLKRITVHTKEDGAEGKPIVKSTALEIRVTIPQPVIFKPRLVYWRPGEILAPKKVQVLIDYENPVEVKIVKVTGGSITAQLNALEDGKNYELILAPDQLEQQAESVAGGEPAKNSNNLAKSVLAENIHNHQPEVKHESAKQDGPTPPKAPSRETRSVIILEAKFGEKQTRSYKIIARIMANPKTKNNAQKAYGS